MSELLPDIEFGN